MLSFKKGFPVAYITGGSATGKILKVHDGTESDDDYVYETRKLKKYDTVSYIINKLFHS